MGSLWQFRGDGGFSSRVIPPSTTVFSSSTCFLTTLPFTSTFTASHISRFSPRTSSIYEHTTTPNNYYKRTIGNPSFSSSYRIHSPEKFVSSTVDTRIPSYTKTTNITSPIVRTKIFDPVRPDKPSKPMNEVYTPTMEKYRPDKPSKPMNELYTPTMDKYNSRLSGKNKPFEPLSSLHYKKDQTSMYDLIKSDTDFSRSKYHLPSASAYASQQQMEKQARKTCSPIKEAYDVDLTKSINLNRYLKEYSPVSLSNKIPVNSYEDIYKHSTDIIDKYSEQVDKDKNLLSSNIKKKTIDKPMFKDQVARKSESNYHHKNNWDTKDTTCMKQSSEDKKIHNSIKESYISKESSEIRYLPHATSQDTENNQNEKMEKRLETSIDNTKTKYVNQYEHHSIKPTSTQDTSNNFYKRYIEEAANYTIPSCGSQYKLPPPKSKEIGNNAKIFTNNVAEKVGKFENQINGVTRASVTWKKHYNSERRRWQNKERFDNASTPTQHCPTHPTFGKDPKRYLSANLSTSTYNKRQGEGTENSDDMIKEAQSSLTQYKDLKETLQKTLPEIQRRYTPREMKMARSIFKNISDTQREEQSKLIGYGKPRIERPLMVGQI